MGTGPRFPSAMIIGGHFPSLGAARNLAEHGVPVFIADHQVCISRFSRSVKRSFRCPPPEREDAFLEFLQDTARRMRFEGCVLFPSTDESVRALSQHRDELSDHYVVTTPPWEVTRFFYDKRLTHVLAAQQAVPTPATWQVRDGDELETLAVEFPVVLKAAISTRFSSVTKKKGYRADNLSELKLRYGLMAAVVEPSEILIQELIPGRTENLYSAFGLFQSGRMVAGGVAKRIRQHPMEFGRASTYAVTVRIPELEELADRLLSGIGYSGLAEVEFMYHPEDGQFELLEVNPRLWGWHTLAVHAGLDLPYLAYASALGLSVPVGDLREGAKWMRLATDLPTAVAECCAGRLSVAQYLRAVRGCQDAVLSASDPLPFLMDVILIPVYAKSRGF